MSDLINPPSGGEQSPVAILDDARANYVELLSASRYLIYTSLNQPDYYDVLDQGAQEYCNAFGEYLLRTAEVEQPDATSGRLLTIDEIRTRRDAIQERFDSNPIRLYPETELMIGAAALGEIGTNILADHPTAVGGSALLVATSYMSYKYRKNTHLTLDIRDGKLITSILESNEGDVPNGAEFWPIVLDATIDSEKSAIARLMSQTLQAHTFNPFGYFRQYYYKYRQRKIKSQ